MQCSTSRDRLSQVIKPITLTLKTIYNTVQCSTSRDRLSQVIKPITLTLKTILCSVQQVEV